MLTRDAMAGLDDADPLASFRDRFLLPEGVIYLDGNSLGPLPKAAPQRIAEVVQREWGESLIRAWNAHGWIDLPHRIGEKIGRVLGAEPRATVVADSTSVNLFKLLAAALQQRPGRRVILTERGNFPTDLYIAQGLADLLDRGHLDPGHLDPGHLDRGHLDRGHLDRGHDVRAVDDPAAALDDSVAVLMLTHVDYRTGAMHDMAALTRAAHAVGALALWDLSHSVGAVPLALAADGVDLAVGCGYKYLNGGPGAPAFLYAAPPLHATLRMPLTGWLGHAAPFDFAPAFTPAPGIARAVAGTPPVLSLAALEVGVDLMLDAPMAALRAKSLRMTETFMTLLEQRCGGCGFALLTPRDEARRGSQVSFTHPEGDAIMQALIARGVIGDFRAPDVLRCGLAPLYLRFVDLWDAVEALRQVMQQGSWRSPAFRQRQGVS